MDAILVPRRADNGRRDLLWSFVSDHVDGLAPIYEGSSPAGPFNRAAAINAAAAAADNWQVAVILDADTYVPTRQIEEAAATAKSTGKLVLAFNRSHRLDEATSDAVMNGGVAPATLPAERHISRCLAVRRDLWDAIGGFDEQFVGWGGEDVAFYLLAKLTGGVERINGPAWHLWHEPSPEADFNSPIFQANAARQSLYENAKSREEMLAIKQGLTT